jgi:hypothetical protein
MSHLRLLNLKVRKKAIPKKMIPATSGPKITENGPEQEFRPDFFRNFEPRLQMLSFLLEWLGA